MKKPLHTIKNSNGFTLIEIVLIVAIIVILTTIVIIAFKTRSA